MSKEKSGFLSIVACLLFFMVGFYFAFKNGLINKVNGIALSVLLFLLFFVLIFFQNDFFKILLGVNKEAAVILWGVLMPVSTSISPRAAIFGKIILRIAILFCIFSDTYVLFFGLESCVSSGHCHFIFNLIAFDFDKTFYMILMAIIFVISMYSSVLFFLGSRSDIINRQKEVKIADNHSRL